MAQHVWKNSTTSQFMSVSSFTLIFGLAEGARLDLLGAVVTQWPQMTKKMTQMTKITNTMTQHDWKISTISQIMSVSSFTLILGLAEGPRLNLLAAVMT